MAEESVISLYNCVYCFGVFTDEEVATHNCTTLHFSKLREANVRRCEEVFHKLDDWSPTDWATAMAGECGEVCNEVKKLRRLDSADSVLDSSAMREYLTTLIGNELADLIIYADLLAARMGIDLSERIKFKFNEVSDKRKSTVKL